MQSCLPRQKGVPSVVMQMMSVLETEQEWSVFPSAVFIVPLVTKCASLCSLSRFRAHVLLYFYFASHYAKAQKRNRFESDQKNVEIVQSVGE